MKNYLYGFFCSFFELLLLGMYVHTEKNTYFVSENIPIFFPYAEKMEPRNHSVCLNSMYSK